MPGGGAPVPPECLVFQLFSIICRFNYFFSFQSEEMPLRNHSAWLQHWLPNERLLTDADSGPEKCVVWQMQVLATKHSKIQVFSHNTFFPGVGGVLYIYICMHIYVYICISHCTMTG